MLSKSRLVTSSPTAASTLLVKVPPVVPLPAFSYLLIQLLSIGFNVVLIIVVVRAILAPSTVKRWPNFRAILWGGTELLFLGL